MSILLPIIVRGSIHPVYHGGHCVCVCVYVCHSMLPPPPISYSQCSWPINLIGGGPRQHVWILCSILARGSIHPVCHVGHSVCVCVFTLACFPHPQCFLPLFVAHLISRGPRQHVSGLLPIIARGSTTLYITVDTVCVFVCVCHCLLPNPPLRPPDFHSPLI